MRINADLHILELEWEDLDSIQLNSPTHIQKYLADTKVINLAYHFQLLSLHPLIIAYYAVYGFSKHHVYDLA